MNDTTDCPELEDLLNALADGSGPELEHAKTCEACKSFLEDEE